MGRLKIFPVFLKKKTQATTCEWWGKRNQQINWPFSWYFQLLWAKLEFDINLFKLVNFQINFESRVKVRPALEGVSREPTGHEKRQGGLIYTVYKGSAKTSVSFPPGRSGASRNKRTRGSTWKRTTWLQGMELTVLGKQIACVLVLILRSQLRKNLIVILALSNVFISGLKLWILACELWKKASMYYSFLFPNIYYKTQLI